MCASTASRAAARGGGDFASALIGDVPGDAFAFLDFDGQGTTDQLGKLKSNPQAAAAIAQFEQEYGVTLDQLLDAAERRGRVLRAAGRR